MSARPPGPRKRLAGLGGTWRECPPRVAVDRPSEYTPPKSRGDNDRTMPHEHDEAHESPDHQHATDHEHGEHPHAHDGRPTLAFVGAGRVGTALGDAFARAGWQVAAVASRDAERQRRFQQKVPGARAFADARAVLDEADLIFLTVPDDAIAGAAQGLQLYSGQALVHTSGALPASVLAPAMAAGTSLGSFHPLVSFADHDQAVADLRGATVAVEGDPSIACRCSPSWPSRSARSRSRFPRAVRRPITRPR